MSGKVLLQWRYPYCKQLSRTRYMDAQSIRSMHLAIANIFFPADPDDQDEEQDDEDDESTEREISDDKQSLASQTTMKDKDTLSAGNRKSSAHPNDDTSTFYNPIAADVSYSMRHVEESWHHLMRSDDVDKFKQIAVCNFDFLLAAVSIEKQKFMKTNFIA